MEKSNIRGTEPKTKQDVSNKHLRLPKNRESISPRPDAKKKPNPQRTREFFDKRPKNRNRTICERYRSEVAEDVDDEAFAAMGCKKKNLNHLLNFTLPPHERRDFGGRRNNRTKFPKYNKELFLQANCQFIARDYGNYSVHEKNPDILVEWSMIEEIRLWCHEVPLCPICLYDPVAAKITRCGHIYCWSCLLHYLSLTDKTWQKCPICFEAVHKNELKSVSLKIKISFNVGDIITLCLMKREKGSLFPAPVFCENPKQICCVDSGDRVARYQKLLLASKKDVFQVISRERQELKNAFMQEKDTPEACFIESALELLNMRENSLDSYSQSVDELQKDTMNNAELSYLIKNESLLSCEPQNSLLLKEHQDALNITKFEDKNEVHSNDPHRKHLESLSSNESYDDAHYSEFSGKSQLSESPGSNNGRSGNYADTEKKGLSFFYQAEDGQHVYLHNLNVRMLIKEYGSLENAPPLIEGKIVEIESVSMTEILRNRLRYLQHLPLTCEFQIVELDFPQILSRETRVFFENDINKRKHFRQKKARDERRREKIIQIEENKKLGKYPKATYNLESIHQFPSYQNDKLNHFSKLETSTKVDSPIPENFELSSPSRSSEIGSAPSTSFAQMLRGGPKTFSAIQQKKELKVEQLVLPLSDDEDYVPPPEFQQSFGYAIQAALESVSLQDRSDKLKTGKKKKEKKLLFTTAMCRNK